MKLIDTHTHLYLDNFSDDREKVIESAISSGVKTMLLPAIDMSTFDAMNELALSYPGNCLPMIGLHPTSVSGDYEKELEFVEKELKENKYVAVGEIGIDLYWDSTYYDQQKDAFRRQLKMAKEYKLPVAIHTRDSFNEIYPIVKEESNYDLKGVFHCFTGTREEADIIIDLGFSMGIGGILTFKNSGLSEVVSQLPMENLLLETDSPFLTPVPFRGKRNQSSYLTYVVTRLAEVLKINVSDAAEATTRNAQELFNI